ncbi:MAG TPA: hypothetical protein VM056_05700, partial [Terriglobales bacterium]|nr:hypothetical protein [Terriglobales bacterium]
MKRARYAIFFILLSTPLISFAQQPDTLAATGDVLTTPEQLRRMAPPEETLTATELEVRADSLRSQKAYADALDYYRAAIRKKETSSLHNKAGISQMQMLRYDDSKKSFERALKLDK